MAKQTMIEAVPRPQRRQSAEKLKRIRGNLKQENKVNIEQI